MLRAIFLREPSRAFGALGGARNHTNSYMFRKLRLDSHQAPGLQDRGEEGATRFFRPAAPRPVRGFLDTIPSPASPLSDRPHCTIHPQRGSPRATSLGGVLALSDAPLRGGPKTARKTSSIFIFSDVSFQDTLATFLSPLSDRPLLRVLRIRSTLRRDPPVRERTAVRSRTGPPKVDFARGKERCARVPPRFF